MSHRLIVHAGMHKTGTSSIQDTLAARLDDPDHAYLQLGGPNGSRAIRAAYNPTFSLSGEAAEIDDQRRAARVQGIRFITRGLNRLDYRTGILSAEVIPTLPEAGLEAFFGLLRLYREDLRVVAYIRRPKSYAESAYQQQLKRFMPTLEKPPGAVRYRDIWTKVERAAGEGSLDLWPFDRARLAGGDVVVDFCHRLGIPLDPAQVLRSNEGLSLPAMQLLFLYRRARPLPEQGDRGVVEALSGLRGAPFHFHSTLAARALRLEPDHVDWAARRTGMDMTEDATAHDDVGIRGEADLERPDAAALDWLAERTGAARASLATPAGIAEAVARLGAERRAGAASARRGAPDDERPGHEGRALRRARAPG